MSLSPPFTSFNTMKALVSELRPAIAATLVLAAVTCGIYPLIVTGVAQAAFKDKAHGSLITDSDGTVRGSPLLGQNFTAAQYFHSRPSAAGAGYDAANSSGSNLGPTSQKLNDAIKERITAYRATNGLASDTTVPADAVTASGSGLDPHISVRNAELQTARIAKSRNLSVEKFKELIAASTRKPDLGILGDVGVNVLKLNLSLDALK
jgi:K+-transporting ATPase ATPase C chain